MSATRKLPALRRGDIVALKRGASYLSVLGVVVSASASRVRVTYGDVAPSVYDASSGSSSNTAKRRLGWHIRPLDAETRLDILACGFGAFPCSKADLQRLEKSARLLRQEVVGEAAPCQPAPAPSARVPAK